MREPGAPPITIRCFCGAVALTATAPPKSVVNCHCGQCRRLSGAAFTSWASFPREAVPLCGDEPVTAFAVTSRVTRHFCRTCGSHVFTTDVRMPQTVGVPAGVIDGAALPAPKAHYFVDDGAPWHAIHDDVPRFGGVSGVEPLASPDRC